MEIIKTKNYEKMSQKAFDVFEKVLNNKPNAVINTTVGASYDGFFEILVDAINNKKLSIEDAIFMNLDEYIAARDAKFTVYSYMYNKFYNLIQSQPKMIELLDGSVDDLNAEIKRYKKVLDT